MNFHHEATPMSGIPCKLTGCKLPFLPGPGEGIGEGIGDGCGCGTGEGVGLLPPISFREFRHGRGMNKVSHARGVESWP